MAHITDVLKKPVLTEKSLILLQEENKYTFDVDVNANKIEIRNGITTYRSSGNRCFISAIM